MSSSILPMFSSKSFTVSGLTFRSLIHFEFIFVYGVRKCYNFLLLHVAIQFYQHHLLKRLSLPHCIFLPALSKIRYLQICEFISGLSILFHWSIFLFLCQYHTVLMIVASDFTEVRQVEKKMGYSCFIYCQFVLYNEVNQLYIYVHPLFLTSLPPPPIPSIQVTTEHGAELLAEYNNFPLAICFTRGSVRMSMPISQFIPPLHSPRCHICSLCLHLYSCSANRFICTLFPVSTYMY